MTGDYAQVDARTINLPPGAVPAPGEVHASPGTHNLPRPCVGVFVGRDDAVDHGIHIIAYGRGFFDPGAGMGTQM